MANRKSSYERGSKMLDLQLPKNKDEYPKIFDSLKEYSEQEQRVILAELGRRDLFLFILKMLY